MSVVAFIRGCLGLGMDMDTALMAAEIHEAQTSVGVDAQAERRRAKDRDRKRLRNSAESAEAAESVAPPPSPALPPQTPLTHPHTPPDITTRARGFAEFWTAYPNKVGKRAAEKSYTAALKRVTGPDPPAMIFAGMIRAQASRKWLEGIIPNPSTWLNQDRWLDEPAEVIPLHGQPHERPHHDAKFAARQANLARAFAGADSAAGRTWKP